MNKITWARSSAGFTVAAVLIGSVNATAQEGVKLTIEVGGMYSVQESTAPTTQDPGYPRPGVGGSTFGFVAGAAVALSPIIDVGVELSDQARFDAIQFSGGTSPAYRADNQHRELIVSGLLRFHQRQRNGQRVRFEGVAGPSVVSENTLQQTAYGPIGRSGPDVPYILNGLEREIARITVGVTGGANLDFSVSHHLSVVPQARLYWIAREGSPTGTGHASALLGLNSLVFRAALSIRS